MKHPTRTKPLYPILCAGIAGLALSGSLTRASANMFQGSSSGAFINPTGPPTMVVSGVGTAHLVWGDPNGFGVGPNTLDFTGTTFSANPETSFTVGTLSFFNGTIAVDTQIDTVSLQVDLSFTDPAGVTRSFTYPMSIVNTPNTGDPVGDADFVTLDPVANTTFVVDGTTYTVHLGFANPTANASFLSGGGLEFHVLEGASASVDVTGVITSNLAGIPDAGSTSALMALAFGGTALLRRKFVAS